MKRCPLLDEHLRHFRQKPTPKFWTDTNHGEERLDGRETGLLFNELFFCLIKLKQMREKKMIMEKQV